VYPEHASNLAWLASRVAERDGANRNDGQPAVLNLFAHTGLATLAAARAGAAVAHVDAARSAVAWARRNAALSGLAAHPIRWLVDDAAAFVAREARRGRRYDGFVLDPPSFGHAGRRTWVLADELADLLAACRAIAADDAFVLLTAHSTGLDGHDLRQALRFSFAFAPGAAIEVAPQELEATSGARLELGWAARLGS
jgi:23S rRNA (cytosine1962-C5)-methyltransferase